MVCAGDASRRERRERLTGVGCGERSGCVFREEAEARSSGGASEDASAPHVKGGQGWRSGASSKTEYG